MRPGTIRSVLAGLERLVRVRALLLLWGFGVLAAAPAAIAVGTTVHAFFGARPAGETIAAGLTPLHLMSFGTNADLAALGPGLLVAGLLWFLLAPMGHGVALAAAGTDRRSMRDLLGRAGATYPRLFGAQLVGLLLLGLTLGPAAAGAKALGGRGLQDWTSEQGVFAARIGLGLGLFVLVGLVKGAVDVVRVRIVVDDAGLLAALPGLFAGLRRPLHTATLVVFFSGLGLLVTGLVSYVDAGFVRDSTVAFAVGVGLQQGTALLRSALRLGLAGAQSFSFATSPVRATMAPRE